MPEIEVRSRNYVPPASDGLSLWSMFRLVTGVAGLSLTVFGALGCVRFFFVVVEFIQKPTGHESLLKDWQRLLGVEDVAIPVAGILLPSGAAIGMLFLTIAAYLALRILIAIMKSGLTLMSWAKAERMLAKQQDSSPISLVPQ